ncbi:hypothetical protein [Streptomyces djakartensis]|uniref:hypothetical protein n=1 Tax=Streptomyces djakartensis TaxID=68193 RepID=UPI0034DF90EC
MQQSFSLDDLHHVRLAARRANNPFFKTSLIHEPYSRVVFLGRGLLFVAAQSVLRPHWRAYLASFTPLSGGAWFTLLPHHQMHNRAEAACQQAEELAGHMHTGTWESALSLFAGRPEGGSPERSQEEPQSDPLGKMHSHASWREAVIGDGVGTVRV